MSESEVSERRQCDVDANIPSVTFIGAGKLAVSIVNGISASGTVPRELISLTCRRQEHAHQLHRSLRNRVRHVGTNNVQALLAGSAILTPDHLQDQSHTGRMQQSFRRHVIFLTVKPTDLRAVCLEIAPHLQSLADDNSARPPIVVAASPGITAATLESWLSARPTSRTGRPSANQHVTRRLPIVRCMPNTPASVREGAVGLFANDVTTLEEKAIIHQLFSAVCPITRFVPKEALLDSVASTSGSGPAYFLFLMEIFESVGQELGLSQSLSRDLAIQSCIGAGELARQQQELPTAVSSFQALRMAIAPQGGSTREALAVLEKHNFAETVHAAILKSYKKNLEMGKASRAQPSSSCASARLPDSVFSHSSPVRLEAPNVATA
ncbi:pyrroline-5-carboxylate reductase dimerization-domain-containing protein [Powellomyces hirtus]|nr:pyrroline-5-carboxylate reductase dimerization-domain-containing protein [Powellomyces hirtus]